MLRKREHLLNQIQAQAKQIETLMRELEMLSSKHDQKLPDHLELKLDDVQLPSDQMLDDSEHVAKNESNEPNEVLDNWVAKAKESIQEFGSLIAMGEASLPKDFVMEKDEEDAGSTDEEYVDAEEPDKDDGPYNITIEDQTTEPMSERKIQHKSSASSMDTRASGQKRKIQAKPASLPVEAAPFGLFGNMMLKSPKSRDASVEPEEEYKGPGIANENFFSKLNLYTGYRLPDYVGHSSCSNGSWSQVGNPETPVASHPY